MKVSQSVLAVFLMVSLCSLSLTGCGGQQGAVIAPPVEDEISAVPGGAMSEEEYAKEMANQNN